MTDYAAKYTKCLLRLKRLEGLVMQEGYSIEKCSDDNKFFIRKITYKDKIRMRNKDKFHVRKIQKLQASVSK